METERHRVFKPTWAERAKELADEISRRELAADQARKRREVLSQEEKLALIGSFEWDIPNNTVTWSDGLYSIYGLKPQEFGASFEAFLERVHPDHRERVQGVILEAYQEGKGFEIEELIVRSDGAIRVLASRGEVMKDENDVPVRMVGICQDITERKKAEGELLESEALKSAILESALDCIITMDHEGRIIEFNPAAERTFGYSRDEVIGKELAEMIVPPSLRDRHRADLTGYLATGEWPVLGKRFESIALRADGSEFPVEVDVTAIEIDGPPVIATHMQDISLRKQAEELLANYNRTLEKEVQRRTHQLKQANQELERTLQQLKEIQHQLVLQEKMATLGNLVAGITHEVNNPVGAITSAADVSNRCINVVTSIVAESENLEDIKESGTLKESFELLKANNEITVAAGNRISRMINSLKVFTGLDEAQFTKVSLHDSIDSVLTLIRHEVPEGVRISRNYGEVPPILGYVDELNQVFMNVLLNACQAMDASGEIEVTTFADDTNVFVKVVDTGKGIEPEKLDSLFELGFSTKSSRVAMGMGLFSAYNIVQKHKGEITVTSEVGKGTTVITSLPI